jgi:hypothetical protein
MAKIVGAIRFKQYDPTLDDFKQTMSTLEGF